MHKKVFLIILLIASLVFYGCSSMKHSTVVLYVSHKVEGPLYMPEPEPPVETRNYQQEERERAEKEREKQAKQQEIERKKAEEEKKAAEKNQAKNSEPAQASANDSKKPASGSKATQGNQANNSQPAQASQGNSKPARGQANQQQSSGETSQASENKKPASGSKATQESQANRNNQPSQTSATNQGNSRPSREQANQQQSSGETAQTNKTQARRPSRGNRANQTAQTTNTYQSGYTTRTLPRGEFLIVEEPIRFAFEKYNIDSNYDNTIQYLADFMKQNTNFQLVVEGHTDRIGEYGFNKDLSLMRSRSAITKLRRAGVARNRLIESGVSYRFSEYNFNRLNRRVEFIIIRSPEELAKYREEIKEEE